MIAEQLDFDDTLSHIYSLESQGPLQLRFKYFLQQKEELQKLINACRDLKDSGLLTEKQQTQLQEIIHYGQVLYKELGQNDSKSHAHAQLQHLLSDLINFTPHSLEQPEHNL